MPGPEETRLIQALDGTHPGKASGGADEWENCALLLDRVSRSLATASLPIQPGDAGGRTAEAITDSFHRSAEAMSKRAVKLRDGKGALTSASEAVKTANDAHVALGPEPSMPSYTPHEDPNSPAGIKKHNAYLADMSAYDAEREHREKVAKKQADDMDTAFRKSSATMKAIHGIPDPPPPPPDYDGGSGGSMGGGGKAPAHHTTTSTSDPGGGNDHGTVTNHPGTDDGTVTNHPGTDDGTVTNHPGTDDGGSSEGNVPVRTPGPVIGDPFSPTGPSGGGVSGSTGLGLAGAAAGGVGGGVLGTGLATGGIRGGGLAPITTGGGTAASGARGIGATSRSGVSGTLGRSGGMSSTAAGTGTASRGAGGARTGGTSAGRGAGTRGRAGSRGAAGGRGAAAGSAAGGRSGRSKDDEKKSRRGEFDDTEDWIDDEDAAPGIID